MARRKTKCRRSRSRNDLNILTLAQGAVMMGFLTKGFFGVNVREFLSNNVQGTVGGTANQITLKELVWTPNFGIGKGSGNFQDMVTRNLQTGGFQMLTGVLLTPVAFKFAKKAARPFTTPVNRMLRGTGVKL